MSLGTACTVSVNAWRKSWPTSSLRRVYENGHLTRVQPATVLILACWSSSSEGGRTNRKPSQGLKLVCRAELEILGYRNLLHLNYRGGRAFYETEGAEAMAPTTRKEGGPVVSTLLKGKRSPALKFWDDCADPTDIQALWAHPAVKNEWLTAGEKPGQKVHLSRAFEGKVTITEIEMRVSFCFSTLLSFARDYVLMMEGSIYEQTDSF
jgi:hypothetical protein